jgi:hypothetical protein
MVAIMSSVGDRFAAVWLALINLFIGRKAVKTVDACALYWGVIVKASGNKVDVRLDTDQIASPSNVPLYLGLPGSSVTLQGGERVLVGFRNGDPTQPYAIAFEFSASMLTVSVTASTSVTIDGTALVDINGTSITCGPVGTIPVLVVGSTDSVFGLPILQFPGCTNALKAG